MGSPDDTNGVPPPSLVNQQQPVQYAPPPPQGYAPPPGPLPAGQQYAPPPSQQYAPPPTQQYAPPPGQQYAPPPGQQYAPVPTHGQYAPPPLPNQIQYQTPQSPPPSFGHSPGTADPPPSFEEAVAGTGVDPSKAPPPEKKEDPPNYMDITLIPEDNILYRANVKPMTASTAKFERKADGISTADPIVQDNPDELFRFFMTHLLEKPGLLVQVTGTHQESHQVHETHTDSDGHVHHTHRTEVRTVTDFTFSVDASAFVQPDWTAIFALPKDKNVKRAQNQNVRAVGAHMPEFSVPPGQFRQALEEFTTSKNLLKEKAIKERLAAHYPIGIDVQTFYQMNIANIAMAARSRAMGLVIQAAML
ncbi:hypothetical protein HDU97_006178 [Phlyctochytrium planicorne]|nr:hypothetical protein HDU97_006178 [Phlyctochytrium planicorne]